MLAHAARRSGLPDMEAFGRMCCVSDFQPPPLPPNLPVPEDDGAADHLAGMRLPSVSLPGTAGEEVLPGEDLIALFCYPHIADPEVGLPGPDWDRIPGARGCTPEACGFRDVHAEFAALGARVLGVSTDDVGYQRAAAARLGLPYPLLSDAGLELARAWDLPLFEAGGRTLLKRLTLLLERGTVERAWYPVFPPDRHAAEVLAWLGWRRGAESSVS
jgi:peroxiredoxin